MFLITVCAKCRRSDGLDRQNAMLVHRFCHLFQAECPVEPKTFQFRKEKENKRSIVLKENLTVTGKLKVCLH